MASSLRPSGSALSPFPAGADPDPDPDVAISTPLRLHEGRPLRRKRPPRASQACEMCRARKTKCDQQLPCSHCEYHALECHYRKNGAVAGLPNGKRRGGDGDATSAKQRPRFRPTQWPTKPRDHQSRTPLTDLAQPAGDNNKSSEATPMNAQAQIRYADTNIVPERFEVGELELDSVKAAEEESAHEDLLVNGEAETTGLGGINAHTSGTEFYGGSSNLAFLDRLFSQAIKRARSCTYHESDVNKEGEDTEKLQDSDAGPRYLSNSQLSIVNLMYSADYPASIPGQTASIDPGNDPQNNSSFPLQAEIADRRLGDAQSNAIHTRNRRKANLASDPSLPSTEEDPASSSLTLQSPDVENREVEKIFIQTYFTNKHYIHPLLRESDFRARCTKEIWTGRPEIRSNRSQRHRSRFLALYFAVVALGAINAEIDDTSPLTSYYRNVGRNQQHEVSKKYSTLEWASFYFDLAQEALGDVFEISSLDTCQALFLMTVFCQNALKPHACYMYSGMAVRTAIAIGLSNETYSGSMTTRNEARRTWWCIYSHEVEMCCSSGRLDGLKDPRHYFIPLPELTKVSSVNLTDIEGPDVAMIPVMVELSQILKTASQDIYHDSTKRSIKEKSQISFKLEALLTAWKNNLPNFLNIDTVSLSDPEWAFKQKLVLRMRIYNARILIHRPFLVASSTSYNSSEFSQHVEICLDASRKTIQMIYDSFVHRIYLRTWWYCTTYTLYASMIILHLILLEFPKVSGEELIEDVEKSLEIFSAMRSVLVARRCAELTREILAVAKRYLRDRRRKQAVAATGTPIFRNDSLSNVYDENMTSGSETWDDSILMALLNQEGPGPVRANALANLLDPNILEDFAVGNSIFDQTAGSEASMEFSDYATTRGGQETGSSGVLQHCAENGGILGHRFPQLHMGSFHAGGGWT